MATINWTVPIDTNAIPSNINQLIAQGPQNVLNLNDAVSNYNKGQQEGYQQRNQNAFQGGLPMVMKADGTPQLDLHGQPTIDWNAVGDQLARVGGTAAVPSIIGLRSVGVQQQIADEKPPSLYPENGNNPPPTPPSGGSTTPNVGQQPQPNGQTTDMTVTPGSTNGATAAPVGTPAKNGVRPVGKDEDRTNDPAPILGQPCCHQPEHA
jgi:hypothetical protein